MTTLAILKARVADELNRNDLTNQIGYAVNDAIALYQTRRFRFNQTRATFSTTAGTEFYTTSVIPTDIVEVDSLRITVNGRMVILDKWSYLQMDEIATTTNTRGQPRAWSWYANQIRLYPVPDATYTLTISYLQRIAAPASDTDSNVWTDEAASLIRHSAKRMIYSDVLMNQGDAAACAQSEGLEVRRHQREAEILTTGGLRGSM